MAGVKAMNRGGDLCANPTINRVSTEGFSIKATAAELHRSPNRNLRSSGSGLINIQITAAQLNRLKSVFPFYFSSLLCLLDVFHNHTFKAVIAQQGEGSNGSVIKVESD